MTKLEKVTEASFKRWVEARGLRCIKLKLATSRGFPDRTILGDGMVPIFIEMKRSTGSRTAPEQIFWQRKLRSMGYISEICKTLEEAQDVILQATSVPKGSDKLQSKASPESGDRREW